MLGDAVDGEAAVREAVRGSQGGWSLCPAVAGPGHRAGGSQCRRSRLYLCLECPVLPPCRCLPIGCDAGIYHVGRVVCPQQAEVCAILMVAKVMLPDVGLPGLGLSKGVSARCHR